MKEKEKSSLVDLGKRLLEASRKGLAEEVSMLMASGAPFTTDWVRHYLTMYKKIQCLTPSRKYKEIFSPMVVTLVWERELLS